MVKDTSYVLCLLMSYVKPQAQYAGVNGILQLFQVSTKSNESRVEPIEHLLWYPIPLHSPPTGMSLFIYETTKWFRIYRNAGHYSGTRDYGVYKKHQ